MVLTHLFWQKPLKVNGNQLLLFFFLPQMINQNKKKKAFLDYRLDDLYVWSVFPVNYIRHLSNDQFWTKDTELESFVNLIVCFSSISIMNITRNYKIYVHWLPNVKSDALIHFHFRNDTSLCDNSSLAAESSNYEDACTLSEKAIRGNEKRKRRGKQWLFFN